MRAQQKKAVNRTGCLITGIIVADIVLSIAVLWHFFDGKADSAASIQAIAAIIALGMAVFAYVFEIRGKQIAISQLPSIFAGNRSIQVGSVCVGLVLATLVAFELGASSTAIQTVTFTDQEVSLDIVQAQKIFAEAEVTTQFGPPTTFVRRETKDSKRASGALVIINTIEQAVPLPEETQFIARNALGNEVRYIIDSPVIVPAAVTSVGSNGRLTTYGQIVVSITALESGESYNINGNSINQILIPRQQPIISDSSNFLIRHAPITGGLEQTAYTYVPNEKDRQRQLDDALTKLHDDALRELREQANLLGNNLSLQYMTPDRDALNSKDTYEVAYVSPPSQSSQHEEQAKVTVRARFSALAVPSDRLLNEQLTSALPAYLAQQQTKYCTSGHISSVTVTNTRWDGKALKVSGIIACSRN